MWSDKTGPAVSKPRVVLKVGNSVGTGVATVKWNPLPKKAEVERFMLQRKVEGGLWKDVELSRPKGWKTDAWVKIDAKTRFRVKAQDKKGIWGRWSYGPGRQAAVRGPAGTTISGLVGTAAAEAQHVKTTFSGRSIAVVARTGPGMGALKVLVDGKRVATVDLERAEEGRRTVVWAKNWADKGTHTVLVKPVDATERIDFNGFFVLR